MIGYTVGIAMILFINYETGKWGPNIANGGKINLANGKTYTCKEYTGD